MEASFEYAPCAQRAKYHDYNISVIWDLSKRLKYISFHAPGKFTMSMYKKNTLCSLGDGQHIECEPNPLLDSLAVYLENTIADLDQKSIIALFNRVENASAICFNSADFVTDVDSIIREILISQYYETARESADEQSQGNSEQAVSSEKPITITIVINKSTAIMAALAIAAVSALAAIATVAAMQAF